MTRGRHPAWSRRRRRRAPDTATMQALAGALRTVDEASLRALLHPDVILIIDSGGALPSASSPIEGDTAAASALAALLTPDTSISLAAINGAPGLIFTRGDVVVTAVTAEMTSTGLSSVWVVCNPTKLEHWNRR